ncbi:MAG: alkaline phosphatase family protein, partial [Solimonas sp.]
GWSLALSMGVLLCSAAAQAGAPPPKLIVAISVDQFSAGLFEQYRPTFSGGLARMAGEGVVFPNGYQSHAATETCPGHSTILTGRHPSGTGIVANAWYGEPGDKPQKIYCVSDDSTTVPGRDEGRGPAKLRVSTLGEWLHQANAASRTVAVSGKDRAAITLAGHDPTAVFWWDDEKGFNTYVPAGQSADERLKPVAAFNDEIARRWAKGPPRWKPIDKRCNALYGSHAYGALNLEHRVPPVLPLDPGKPLRDDKAFKSWLRASPELDRITLELAGHLAEQYELGRRDATDVLAISLSATDYVGHRYGNQGPEMCEQMAALDRMLGDFLERLDDRKLSYLVVLTADHGAMDAAERVAERGIDAERLPGTEEAFVARLNEAVRDDLNKSLPAKGKLDVDPFYGDAQALYLTRKVDAKLKPKLIASARAWLEKEPKIAAVFSKDEALAGLPPANKPVDELTLLERFAESTDAERSGDLQIAWQPYIAAGEPKKIGDTIAGHGSPWNYDRRVPIVFWWPDARGFEQYLPIETVDIAPTLAAIVGVVTPPVDGRCRDLDRGAASTCALAKSAPARP